ncbi:hypothetical protein DFH94DRAFT_601780, partial [Russula ochroleuca]
LRLLRFDALRTLITSRKPIHVQYAEVFGPHTLRTQMLAHSSLVCYIVVARLRLPYRQRGRADVDKWWSDVISRTAVGAGPNPQAVESRLGTIVPNLMRRFSSRGGYHLFDD